MYPKDLKTPTIAEIVAEYAIIFSLLCILTLGKLLNLSKYALTIACGCPNFRSSVFRASLYIEPQ